MRDRERQREIREKSMNKILILFLAAPSFVMRLTPLSDQYKIGSKVVFNKNLFWDCLVGHILISGITTIKNVYYNEKNCCNNICVITIVGMSCHYKI